MAEIGFRLHPAASQDVETIWEYIARDNIQAAGKVRMEILQTFRQLAQQPAIGHRRSDLTGRPLRFWRIRDYLIAYAPEEMPLWVIAVVHGRRDSRILATILQSREIPN